MTASSRVRPDSQEPADQRREAEEVVAMGVADVNAVEEVGVAIVRPQRGGDGVATVEEQAAFGGQDGGGIAERRVECLADAEEVVAHQS